MKRQKILTRILDAAILISMAVGLAILIAAPFLGGLYQEVCATFPASAANLSQPLTYLSCLRMPPFWTVIAAVYITGVLYFCIAFDARRLTKNILYSTPFAHNNVRALRRIAILAFVECLLFAASTLALFLLHYSIFMVAITLIIAIAAAFVSIIGAVLTQLLQRAIAIKEENDLTI